MKSKIFFILIPCFIMIDGNSFSQENSSHIKLTSQEKSALLKAIEEDSVFAEWVKDTSNAIQLYEKYKTNLKNSDSVWESDQKRLEMMENVGYTEKFEFIPLIESLQGNPKFKTGEGVSYLIRTDHSTILFDTGWDDDSTMCAFRYNLDLLGIDVNEIDVIFISHNHGDHQNEWKWTKDKTFVNLDNENILSKIKIYVPRDTLNLKIDTKFSNDPVKISEGVYSTGIITVPLFFNSTQEQGLVFNVKDKGIIIVTGCGHQTVGKLLQRCDRISDKPIYGILGGLHFPIFGDSERYMSYFIAGLLPWETFTLDDVVQKIELIKKQELKLIGISTHDSGDKTIEAFKKAFSNEYKDLRIGDWVAVK